MKNYNTINEAWLDAICQLPLGATVSPRRMETREIVGASYSIWMTQPVLTVVSRVLSYEFMFAEAHWILTGDNRLESLIKYAPSYARFSDDGHTLRGAYGPNVINQLDYVHRILLADPDSRQAILSCWNKNPPPSKDIPCTLSLQFLMRSGGLDIIHTMRSSDIWLGFPYDFFSMVMIAAVVCLKLRGKYPSLNLGTYFFNAGSQHLYSHNFGAVDALNANAGRVTMFPCPVFHLCEFRNEQHLIDELRMMKDKYYKGITSAFFNNLSEYLCTL